MSTTKDNEKGTDGVGVAAGDMATVKLTLLYKDAVPLAATHPNMYVPFTKPVKLAVEAVPLLA